MPPAAPFTRQHGQARIRWQMNLMMVALALLAPRVATLVAGRGESALPGTPCASLCVPHWRGDIAVTSILGIRG
jgi:hypothetical protein